MYAPKRVPITYSDDEDCGTDESGGEETEREIEGKGMSVQCSFPCMLT